MNNMNEEIIKDLAEIQNIIGKLCDKLSLITDAKSIGIKNLNERISHHVNKAYNEILMAKEYANVDVDKIEKEIREEKTCKKI